MNKFKETGDRWFTPPNRVQFVRNFLEKHYGIKVNEFDASKVCITPQTREYAQEVSVNDVRLHMEEEEGFRVSEAFLRSLFTSSYYTQQYNPVTDYFNSLKGKYGGVSHIDLLAGYLKAHDYEDKPEADWYQKRLVRTLKKWFVAAAACVLKQRENDVCFIIVNREEGIGKSTLLRFIVPEELKEYYTVFTKKMELAETFTTKFIVNFDETVGLNHTREDEFKSILSLPAIDVTKRSLTSTRRRYASACGTSNRDEEAGGFLLSDMGLRRFCVHRIDSISWAYTKEVDVNQLWAEAVMLLDEDFEYVWNPEDYEDFSEYNQRFIKHTYCYQLVKEWYRIPETGEEETGVFKMPTEILKDLRASRKIHPSTPVSMLTDVLVGKALRQLGFSYTAKKINGKSRYGYMVIPLF